MVESTANYEGSLRTSATHGPSGCTVETDAPVDNQGRGERFSPTDLVATALGSCMLTIMGIFAERHEIDITGAKVRVEKHMTPEAPRRISRIVTEITIPLPENHPQRPAMEKASVACPVHLSLHPEIKKDVTFLWAG